MRKSRKTGQPGLRLIALLWKLISVVNQSRRMGATESDAVVPGVWCCMGWLGVEFIHSADGI